MNDEIVGLVAVVLLFGGGTLFLLSISPIGKAIAAKILGRKTPVPVDDVEETAEDVKALRGEVEELRHAAAQIAELGERVDFLERLLAQQREGARLPAGKDR